MTVNVGYSVLMIFFSSLNVQLLILDLGLPTADSQCFLFIRERPCIYLKNLVPQKRESYVTTHKQVG